jgi:hypothetical protein
MNDDFWPYLVAQHAAVFVPAALTAWYLRSAVRAEEERPTRPPDFAAPRPEITISFGDARTPTVDKDFVNDVECGGRWVVRGRPGEATSAALRRSSGT